LSKAITMLKTGLWTTLLVIWFWQDAHAYLDPSTGSYVFQSVVAGALGAAYAVKVYWRNIRSIFANGRKRIKD